jgi:hypothetical protein
LWVDRNEREHLEDLNLWEEGFKMDLPEIIWVSTNWIDLAQDKDSWPAVVNAVMNPRVPKIAENFGTT